MANEGYRATLAESGFQEASADDKFKLLTQSLLNLQKVCSSIIDLYSTMHNALLVALNKQLNFDVREYSAQLDVVMRELLLKRERLEDEIYGINRVQDSIVDGDIVKLVIDRNEDGNVISNRMVGGVYYIIGKGQLLPQIEQIVKGLVTGDKATITVEESGKKIGYAIEVMGVKRRKINDDKNKQPQ